MPLSTQGITLNQSITYFHQDEEDHEEEGEQEEETKSVAEKGEEEGMEKNDDQPENGMKKIKKIYSMLNEEFCIHYETMVDAFMSL